MPGLEYSVAVDFDTSRALSSFQQVESQGASAFARLGQAGVQSFQQISSAAQGITGPLGGVTAALEAAAGRIASVAAANAGLASSSAETSGALQGEAGSIAGVTAAAVEMATSIADAVAIEVALVGASGETAASLLLEAAAAEALAEGQALMVAGGEESIATSSALAAATAEAAAALAEAAGVTGELAAMATSTAAALVEESSSLGELVATSAEAEAGLAAAGAGSLVLAESSVEATASTGILSGGVQRLGAFLSELVERAAGSASALLNFGGSAEVAAEEVELAGHKAEEAEAGFGRLAEMLEVIGAIEFGKHILEETAALDSAQTRLAAAVLATGEGAGWTAEQIGLMAEKAAEHSTNTRAEETSVASLLLTFKNIKGENFPAVLQAVNDISAGTGRDLQTVAVQVGRAFNEPTQALGALSRMGIQFSESEKETIKTLVESGDRAGAYNVILQRLAVYHGQAEAQTRTLGGAFKDLKKNLDEEFIALLNVSGATAAAAGNMSSLAHGVTGFFAQIGSAAEGTLSLVFGFWASLASAYTTAITSMLGGIEHFLDLASNLIGKSAAAVAKAAGDHPVIATALGFTPEASAQLRGFVTEIQSGLGSASSSVAVTSEKVKDAGAGLSTFFKDFSDSARARALAFQQLANGEKEVGEAGKTAGYDMEGMSKAGKEFALDLAKQIALLQEKARASSEEADATLLGASAARAAKIASEARKLIIEEEAKAEKAHTVLLESKRQQIIALVQAISGYTEAAAVNKALVASDEALDKTLVMNKARLMDAIAGNNHATLEATELEGALLVIRQRGLAFDDPARQHLIDDANARAASNIELADSTAKRAADQAATNQLRLSEAALQDAIHGTTAATAAETLRQQAETQAKKEGLKAGSDLYRARVAELTLQGQRIAGNNAEAASITALNALRFDEQKSQAELADEAARLGFTVAMTPALEEIVKQYGLYGRAAEAVALEEQARQRIAKETAGLDEKAAAQKAAAIREELGANQKLIDSDKTRAESYKAFADQVQGVTVDFLSQLEGIGTSSWDDMLKHWLQSFEQMLNQMIAKWAQAQFATSAASGGNGITGGSNGGIVGGLGSIFGNHSGPADTGVTSNSSGFAGGGFGVDGGTGAAGGTAASGGGFTLGAGAVGAGAGIGGAIGGAVGGTGGSIAGAAFGIAATAWAVPVYGWVVSVVAAIVGVVATLVTAIAGNAADWAKIDLGTEKGQIAVTQLRGVSERVNQLNPIAVGIAQGANSIIQGLGGMAGDVSGVLETISRKGHGKNTDYTVQFAHGLVADFGNDFQKAAEFATIQAIKASTPVGLSPEISAAIQNSQASTLADFQKAIEFGQKVHDYGLSAVAQSVEHALQQFQADMAQAAQLKIPTENIYANLANQMRQLKDQILGIQLSPQEKLKQDADAYNRELVLEKAQIQDRITQEKMTVAQATLNLAVLKAQLEAEGEGAKARMAFARTDLDAAGATLTAAETIMEAMGAADDAIRQAQLDIAANQKLLNDLGAGITQAEIDAAMKRLHNQGAGSGNSGLDNLKSMIDQVALAVRQAPMDDYAKGIDNISRKWDEEIAKLGKNHDAIERANAARQKEIDLAKQQELKSVGETIKPLVQESHGLSTWNVQFSALGEQWAKTLADAIAAGAGKPLQDRIKAAETQALHDLGTSALDSLNLPMVSALEGLKKTADALKFLSGNADQLGLSAQRVAEIVKQSGQQVEFSIADAMLQYTTDAEDRKAIQQAEWVFQKALWETQIESAHTLGLIADDVYNRLERILHATPDQAPVISQGAASATSSLADAATSAAESLKKFAESLTQNSQLTSLTPAAQLAQAKAYYDQTTARAWTGDSAALGNEQQAAQDYLAAERAMYGSAGPYGAAFSGVLGTVNALGDKFSAPGAGAAPNYVMAADAATSSITNLATSSTSVAGSLTSLTSIVTTTSTAQTLATRAYLQSVTQLTGSGPDANLSVLVSAVARTSDPVVSELQRLRSQQTAQLQAIIDRLGSLEAAQVTNNAQIRVLLNNQTGGRRAA